MFRHDIDGPFLNRWSVRGGLIVLGLTALMVVLNVMPEIHDPTEGVVLASFVNDQSGTVTMVTCEDKSCHHLLPGRTDVQPGEAFRQNIAPSGRVRFLIGSDGRIDDSSQCVELVVGETVLPTYDMSVLQPCDATGAALRESGQ